LSRASSNCKRYEQITYASEKKPARPAGTPAKAAAPKSGVPKLSAPVAALKHKDKRANIPTEELRDFVAGDI